MLGNLNDKVEKLPVTCFLLEDETCYTEYKLLVTQVNTNVFQQHLCY